MSHFPSSLAHASLLSFIHGLSPHGVLMFGRIASQEKCQGHGLMSNATPPPHLGLAGDYPDPDVHPALFLDRLISILYLCFCWVTHTEVFICLMDAYF